MRAFVKIHLVDGSAVDGDWAEMTPEEETQAKDAIADICGSSEGWQLNIISDGDWACFPGKSVLYVELVYDKSDA